nr:hypothetical protein [Tanacetum cinerariifolium]
INHVKVKAKEDPAVKRYQAMKRKPHTKAQARKNMMMYLKNVAGFSAVKQKLMSLDNAAEARLMLLSLINVVEVKLMLSRQS